MSYDRTIWVDNITEVNAETMNNMEDGIITIDNALSAASESVGGLQTTANTLAIADKIKTSTFSVTLAGTTHIVHGLVYNSLHDQLIVVDMYTGRPCTLGIEYTENADTVSIDLVGWSVTIGDSFDFTVYQNIK